MKLENLISRGYFPEELPPPYNTELLGKEAIHLEMYFKGLDNSLKKYYRETNCLNYSIPKVGLSRRILNIPNPIHQIELSNIISSHWSEIKVIYDKSKISSSKQIEDESNNRASATVDSFSTFKEKCLQSSFNKRFELKIDISKYFPSIYTHSIPWAIHSKELAKKKRNDFALLGNLLDRAIRNGQSGQTKGIPIGTDTSRITAEILGCTFDSLLTNKFPSIVGYRYVDDCFFYFESYAKAEEFFKYFQSILTKYSLDINEEKTKIRQLPFPFESNWSIELSNYQIRKTQKGQRTDIKNYISHAFKLVNEYPNDSVLKFAIKKLFYFKIFKQNWDLFESLIYKMAIAEPVILPEILKIILSYKGWVSKIKLKKFIHSIIGSHIYKGHHFEVSWALWLANSFSIKINKRIAQEIFNSKDIISIIIAFEMRAKGLINNNIDISQISQEFTKENFIKENWLLVYEVLKKKWVRPKPQTLLSREKYFNELKKRGVEFYDSSKQVQILEFKKPKTQTPPKTYTKKLESAKINILKEGNSKLENIIVLDY